MTTGLGRCKIFWIIRQCLYWPKFLLVMVSYYFYSWAIQLIRGIFSFDISVCWVQDLCCVFWYLLSWSSWWSRRQGGQEIPEWFMYRHSWRLFWICPWGLPVSWIKLCDPHTQCSETQKEQKHPPRVLLNERSTSYAHTCTTHSEAPGNLTAHLG